jgi:thiopeptide-type bacteriocin biosynthesis protein
MGPETAGENSRKIEHSGFFVLRTPMLAIEELTSWSNGLTSANTWQNEIDSSALEHSWRRDVQNLRCRLRNLIARPEIIHALYVASPSLEAGIEHWMRNPDSKKGLQAQRTLVRYFIRMAARSTPFGLFSGCSVGYIKPAESRLTLKPRPDYEVSCRLDFDYLFALTAAFRQDPAIESELQYWPNSSLHRVANSWYYTEARMNDGQRTHHLVAIEDDPYFSAAISEARQGATIGQLIESVLKVQGEDSPSKAEVKEYVLDLVRNEVLVSELSPILTGIPALDDIIATLESLPSGLGAAAILREVRSQITTVESNGLTCPIDFYKMIASKLEKLPAKFDKARLFQVDMVKPCEHCFLSEAIVSELTTGVNILCRLGLTREPADLKSFRKAFSERYEQAMVPLLDALNEESGVGFGTAVGKNDASPILRGLRLRARDEVSESSGDQVNVHESVVRQVVACIRDQKNELDLDVSQIGSGSEPEDRLAEAFSVLGTLVASSSDELQRGNFEFYLQSCSGPSGATLLGRFCYANEEIERGVRKHIKQEELQDPEAVYAEIVYLPEGSVGNVLSRPLLRDYEIPYLGRSGAPSNRRILINDLLVGLEGDNIVLYSRRLRRRIIPRLTTAHGFMNPQLSSIYRFLCCLQHQHGISVPAFSFGVLEALDYLPRVRIGRLILALARWRLSATEIEKLRKVDGSQRFYAVQELRSRRRLPRWVVLKESDNNLPVDLDNALSVDALVHVLKRGSQATLVEMYPSVDQMCAISSEGSFHHELNVPLVRKVETASANPIRPTARRLEPTWNEARNARLLTPGCEWLYVKLYGGPGILDQVLTNAVAPLVRKLSSDANILRWFFVRYSDPHPHLRIRFNGTNENLAQYVLPQILDKFNPLVYSGELWKIEFDTYQREIERYGGIEGILSAEEIFWSDSESTLEILQKLAGDDGIDMRWRIVIVGIDQLLSDFGFDLRTKYEALHRWSRGAQRELKVDTTGKKNLAERFREKRREIELLLDRQINRTEEWDFAYNAFDLRSSRNSGPCQNLRKLSVQGKLTESINDLALCCLHMHINRFVRASLRVHELVFYDFLGQLYGSKLARNALSWPPSAEQDNK